MSTKLKYAGFLFAVLLSCNKYKYSKPCSINFKTEFVSADPDAKEKTSVKLNVERITLNGERTESGPVEIEKKLNGSAFELKDGKEFDLDMDIPVGTYESYTLKMRLSSANSFRLQRNTYNNFDKNIVVSFDSDIDLVFNSSSISPKLEKDKNYNVSLVFDIDAIFAGIDEEDLENASNGSGAALINANQSPELLQIIKSNLNNSISVKINE
ncbi:MAG: hypothetical protein K0R65_296 [Crocinitomicaceae bacterium]|jgi:hypothetical protein|nr:hypothetical protein [Crocinitomicaceae bacterium]